MSGKTCQHCGCSEIDIDKARGDAVCTNCGSVLEANIIVSEVQFEENAQGGASALGQFVSMDGNITHSITDGLHVNFVRESRVITLENGRRKITEVAQQLRLNQHCIDMAFNFFKMAVHRHLTRGRRHVNVVAACLYIVCRTEGTPHMLLDFCDILQVNVYDLGKTYLRLSAALCLNIPAIDPCLYIVRFAHRLQFGDKTHEVSMTALRLVQRMKRDWMHMGRRPSGLCGAALLVAARLHEFNRTPGDIIKVVKVCNSTLRKRLTEFGDTPSSRLTLEEFMNIDLEEEQDPPAFKAARQKARLKQLGDVDEVSKEVTELQKEIERQLEEKRAKLGGIYAAYAKETTAEEQREITDATQFVQDETLEAIQQCVDGESLRNPVPSTSNSAIVNVAGHPVVIIDPATTRLLTESIEKSLADRDNGEPPAVDDGELDLTGIDDAEVDMYILSRDEVKRKSDLWHKVNAEYLREMEEKEERLAKEREEAGDKPEKKKRPRRKKQPIKANTAGEAIEKMLQEKRLSTKINYDVLRNLTASYGDRPSATAATDMVVKMAPVEDEQPAAQPAIRSAIKRIAEESDEKVPSPKVQCIDELIVESGPMESQDQDDQDADYEEDMEDYDDEDHMVSVAELLRQHRGEYDDS